MSTTPGGTRADTWDVKVGIIPPGQSNPIGFGTYDQQEGGDVDSEEFTWKPGGMKDPESLGGSRTVENLTIRRLYKLGRDHIESDRLIGWVGKARAIITKQPLDQEGNVWGKPIVYRGILKRVGFPDHDSTSSDAGLIEMEFTVDGMPTGMQKAG
jgi:hypothetical protein